jgi:hypothetical protein
MLYYKDGGKFEGTFKDEMKEGQGVYISGDGNERYEGSYSKDKKHGKGMIFKEGKQEEIMFDMGKQVDVVKDNKEKGIVEGEEDK